MAAAANLTTTTQVASNVTAREIDFVTRFGQNWQHLLDIIGITRPIAMKPGTVLTSKYAEMKNMASSPAEGEVIPYSQAEIKEKTYATVGVEKYRKGVTIELIQKWGYDIACEKTDEAFMNELQQDVAGRFYTYLQTGTLKGSQKTFQRALAIAKGAVVNKFKAMHKTATEIVGFVNVMDLYEYLGDAAITVQTAFGFQYIKDFMGYGTIFLLSDSELPQGKVIATPVENIDLYYVDPGESDFAKAGLAYTVEGETNLIGVHVEGNYGTAVSDIFALLGMTLFAEYIDGICIVEIKPSANNTNPTVASGSASA